MSEPRDVLREALREAIDYMPASSVSDRARRDRWEAALGRTEDGRLRKVLDELQAQADQPVEFEREAGWSAGVAFAVEAIIAHVLSDNVA